jgi:integrase/recombinase XerD
MDFPKIVYTEKVVHKGEQRIRLIFGYDKDLAELIKTITHVRYSKTMKSWHLPDIPNHTIYLNDYFDYQVAFYQKQNKKDRNFDFQILMPEVKNAIEAFSRYLKSKLYSSHTIENYKRALNQFFYFHKTTPLQAVDNQDFINYYQNYILAYDLSDSFLNLTINALKVFCRYYDKLNLKSDDLEIQKTTLPDPVILTKDEIKILINGIKNKKQKALITLMYTFGLTVAETIQITINDLDYKQQSIKTKNASGEINRCLYLTSKQWQQLMFYLKEYQPKKYLFESKPGQNYAKNSVLRIFKKALNTSDIRKQATIHSLRFSYAHHLHEAGLDIEEIRERLGHRKEYHSHKEKTFIPSEADTREIEFVNNIPFLDNI